MTYPDGLHPLYHSPPGVDQAVQRSLRWDMMQREIDARAAEDKQFTGDVLDGSHDLAADLKRPMVDRYFDWGCAAAYIVDLVVRETPPQPPNWRSRIMSLGRHRNFRWPDRFALAKGESNFSMPSQDGELSSQELATVASRVFENARKCKVKESAIPLLGNTVQYDKITEIPTGYSELQWDMSPPMFMDFRLRRAYKEGFKATASELGLKGLTVAYAKEIMRRAPKHFRVLPIAEGDDWVRMLTEYGLAFDLEKLSDGTIVRLPTTPKSVWQRTRASEVNPPSAHEIRRTHQTIVERVRNMVRQDSRY